MYLAGMHGNQPARTTLLGLRCHEARSPRWAVLLGAWIVGLTCGCEADVDDSDAAVEVASAEAASASAHVEGPEREVRIGVLDEILREPKALEASDPVGFARAFLESLFGDGDVATAMGAIDWSAPHCRIGVFRCKELTDKAHRVGSLVALVPSARLRPGGMEDTAFSDTVGKNIRRLLPAPDKAMPYIPRADEALVEFENHYRLPRYLLLRAAGKSWRVVAFGRKDQLPKAN